MADEPTSPPQGWWATKATFTAFLTTMLTIGFFALLFMLMIYPQTTDNQLLTAAAGVLFTGASMSWGFYFAKAGTDAAIAAARDK